MICRKIRCSILLVMTVFLVSIICIPSKVFAQPGGISAQAYVLIDGETGTVLAGTNENEQLPMASTTKIMTALLTLEQEHLDDAFTVDEEAIKVEGTSMGLLPGDTVTLRDLCYGMLLSSGNDAANLAAVKIDGTVEQFAQRMNVRAKEIGMSGTNFVTPSGLHNENHYSTAYDMALLAKEALKNEEFKTICSTKKVKLNFGNPPYARWLTNHNKMLDYYEGCIGMKTGFTKAAGRCLVSAAERDGAQLICVTLNAPNDWQDHTSLFDYGFSIVNEGKTEQDSSGNGLPAELTGLMANVVGSEQESVLVCAEGKSGLSEDQRSAAQVRVLMRSFCYAPLNIGDQVGTLQYVQDGEVIAQEPLYSAQEAPLEQESEAASNWLWGQVKKYAGLLF